jgi:hypothetical protein
MQRRFEWRFDELMDQAEASPALIRDLVPRLTLFLAPFFAEPVGTRAKAACHGVPYGPDVWT